MSIKKQGLLYVLLMCSFYDGWCIIERTINFDLLLLLIHYNNYNGFWLHMKSQYLEFHLINYTYSMSKRKTFKKKPIKYPLLKHIVPWTTINFFFWAKKIYLLVNFLCLYFFYKSLHVGGATVSSSSISRVTALLLFWLNYACFVRSSPLQLLDQNCKTVVFRKSEPYIIKESESDKVYQISLYKKSAHALTQKYFFLHDMEKCDLGPDHLKVN